MDIPEDACPYERFYRLLQLLGQVVETIVCTPPRGDDVREPIFNKVEAKLRGQSPSLRDMRNFFFSFAERLMMLGNGTSLRDDALFSGWCKRSGVPGHSASNAAADNYYVEYLTASWLALYFLGQPFSQPWERVRKWVDQAGGGLPNGTCVAKAIGDIIRAARIAKKRPAALPGKNRGGEQFGPDFPVIVLSHLPLMLFRSLVSATQRPGCVPPAAHVLGRCYELLQLRLYAIEGAAIKYFVPSNLVDDLLKKEPDPARAPGEMLKWLCEVVFPTPCAAQCVVLVGIQTLPAVFLNHNSGLYTFEIPARDPHSTIEIPLPASYLQAGRRKLYRETLEKVTVDDESNLLVIGRRPDAASVLEKLLRAPGATG